LQACAPPRAFGPNFSLPLSQQQQGRGYRLDHVDIDAEDREDPMACTTYVNDIFDYLRDSEVSTSRGAGGRSGGRRGAWLPLMPAAWVQGRRAVPLSGAVYAVHPLTTPTSRSLAPN
jgi:hypothetical protein